MRDDCTVGLPRCSSCITTKGYDRRCQLCDSTLHYHLSYNKHGYDYYLTILSPHQIRVTNCSMRRSRLNGILCMHAKPPHELLLSHLQKTNCQLRHVITASPIHPR